MLVPLRPVDEAARLQVLRDSGLLDTPAEERFDRLTRLAQQLLGVPIALVSLVDADRQWFKSKQGLDACETGRDISFCGHAILDDVLMEVSDARLDPRFAGNPLVTGAPGIRFYAGAPLVVGNGQRIGTLCVIDTRPRQLAPEQRQALRDLADCVQAEINALDARVRQTHLRRLSEVARQTTNGVVITDTQGRVEWINEGFTRLAGYTLDELAGSKPGKLLQGRDSDPAAVAIMRAAVARAEPFEVDIVNYHRKGHAYWVHISATPLRDDDGRLQGFIAIESDITRQKADEQRIRESERRLSAVIEGTHIGTWEWNVQSGETVFNERWAEIVGHTLAELAPISIMTWMALAHPDDLSQSSQHLEQHFAGELPYYDCVARMRHKAGHWVWVHDRGRVVSWTDDGKPLLMSGTHADITEQKDVEVALRSSEQRLAFLLAASPVAIYACEPEPPFAATFFSANVEAVSGWPPERFVSDPAFWLDHVHPDDRERVLAGLSKVFEQGAQHHEYRFLRADGDYGWIADDLRLVRAADGQIIEMIGSWMDVSERKRIERLKREFVSTVSHELRTPLTAIVGTLGLLAGGVMGKFSGEVQELLEIADENAGRLGRLINDLLDMEKLDAGRLTLRLQRQALGPLVAQSLRDNGAYAERLGVGLRLDDRCPGVEVDIDADRLRQVLANLLSNAAKYSPQSECVEVTVTCSEGWVRVAVTDRGPGIPDHFRARIFERFAQADASDGREKGGSGLGLAISRELIERMGGRIGFDSEEGKGTTFHIELPGATGLAGEVSA